ncbi:MAG: type II secretion system protein GspJ [Planctomycetota bacterium]
MKFKAAPPKLPQRSTLVGGALLAVGLVYAADVLLLEPEHPEKLVAAGLMLLAAPLAWFTLRQGINVFAAATLFFALLFAGYAVYDHLNPDNALAAVLPRRFTGGSLQTRLIGAGVLALLSLRSAWATARRRREEEDEDEDEAPEAATPEAGTPERRAPRRPARGGGAFSQAFDGGSGGKATSGGGSFSAAFGKRSSRGAFSKAFDNRRGFTLIELMVTMAITALVFAMVAGILLSVIGASERVELELRYEKRGYGALTLIRRDLSGVFAYGLGKVAFKGEDDEKDGQAADTLSFVTSSRVLPPDEDGKVPRLIEVGYKVDSADDLGSETLVLYRRAEALEGDPLTGGDYVELLSEVESFSIEYLNPKTKEWDEKWTEGELLPLAVKITLELMLDEVERIRAQEAGVELAPPRYSMVVGISTSVVPDVGEPPQQPQGGGQQPPPPPGGG